MNARNVEIDGLTCIVRARTWSIQKRDSRDFTFDDLRVIGGNPGDANQDGIDWLGGGDTMVRDAFLRASDDVFALQGNWDGSTDRGMLTPGKDVENILIEHRELSTSISRVVRAAWLRKTFNSRNLALRDSDVLHGGIFACGQAFALLGMWGRDGAKGDHSNYRLEDIFLDDWYSLAEIEQDEPAIHGITYCNIWAFDQPPRSESTLTGEVSGVTFDNGKYGQTVATTDASLPLICSHGAQAPRFPPDHKPVARFSVHPPLLAPGEKVTFTAQDAPGSRYRWLFGDGSEGHGRSVGHRFPDAEGSKLDRGRQGAGNFRVLLEVEDQAGHQDWSAESVVAVSKWQEPVSTAAPMVAGIQWQIYPGS